MDVFILLSGWLIALGMAIWKVFETVRNRAKITIFVGISKHERENGETVNLTVANLGPPVNLIRAGVKYPDGVIFDFPETWQVRPNLLNNMQVKMFQLPLKTLKEFITTHEAPAKVKFIYFTSDRGKQYKIKIPSSIIQVLHN